MTGKLVEKHWDYSLQAAFYKYRPNYSPKAIDMLMAYVEAEKGEGYTVADIGAGTGNLSIMLLQRGLNPVCVEPNDAMRNIGIERTKDFGIARWIKANGVETTLESQSMSWVTFGSSFNVMDRTLALKETHRVLIDGGFFTCMWNHRDIDDPVQKQAEDIIVKFVPDYDRGVRRQDQRGVIEDCPLFKNIFYLEVDFEIEQSLENYINAWKSVRNKYWDLETPTGRALFEKIIAAMREGMPETFKMRYTTRAWTAGKVS